VRFESHCSDSNLAQLNRLEASIQPHFTNFTNTLPVLNQFVVDDGYYAGVHRFTRLMTDTKEGEQHEIKS
jgi:hypothetical protein